MVILLNHLLMIKQPKMGSLLLTLLRVILRLLELPQQMMLLKRLLMFKRVKLKKMFQLEIKNQTPPQPPTSKRILSQRLIKELNHNNQEQKKLLHLLKQKEKNLKNPKLKKETIKLQQNVNNTIKNRKKKNQLQQHSLVLRLTLQNFSLTKILKKIKKK